MKKLLLCAFIVCAIIRTTQSQVTDPTFNPVWAAQLQAAIDDNFELAALHGISVAVYIPGEGTFYGTAGESSPSVPMTTGMQFGVGSNTKLFVSVLALRLQELGIISLDDPLFTWLPSYPDVDGSATIRQCLGHKTGIFDSANDIDVHQWYLDANYGPVINYTHESSVPSLTGPPHFPVNEAYRYSNTNYILVGLALEAATGTSFIDLLHQYIWDPLDMDSTFFAIEETPNGNVVDGWHMGQNIGNVPRATGYSQLWAAGSVFSTTSEMVGWYRHLYNGDIINSESLKQLTTIEPASSYGLGLEFNYFNPEDDAYVHGGAMPGYISLMGYDITRKFVISLLTNENNDDANDMFFITIGMLTEIIMNYPRKADDAGILKVNFPSGNLCNVSSVTPSVEIKNYGFENLTSAVISYQLDNGAVQSVNWSGNLAQDETAIVTLPNVAVSAGDHKFRSFTSSPNDNTEGYEYNNETDSQFSVSPASLPTSLFEDFEGNFPPSGWTNGNNTLLDWRKSTLSLLSGSGCAVKANWFDRSGIEYDLNLPELNLSQLNKPELSFDYAYGYFGQGYDDQLDISVSTDCGQTYHTVFHRNSHALRTADATVLFFPTDNQWKHVTVNLSAYKNYNVLIKITATAANGNNLYIDNVSVDNKAGIQRTTGLQSDEIAVYPNPVSKNLYIERNSSSNYRIELINAAGQVVYSVKENSGNVSINVSDFPNGVYFLKLESEEFSQVEKIAIMK